MVIVSVNDCVVCYCYHRNFEREFIAFIYLYYKIKLIELITCVFRNSFNSITTACIVRIFDKREVLQVSNVSLKTKPPRSVSEDYKPERPLLLFLSFCFANLISFLVITNGCVDSYITRDDSHLVLSNVSKVLQLSLLVSLFTGYNLSLEISEVLF